MKTSNTTRRAIFSAILSCAVLGATQSASAALSLSPVPLFLNNSVEPNVVFVLDDSGSMGWSYLPDTISGDRSTDRAKSSGFNAMYYDPAKTYLTPIDQDGASLGPASFVDAWFNGYSTNRTTNTKTNLSSDFRPTWGGGADYVGTAQPAYYEDFTPSGTCVDPTAANPDSCYTKVVVSNTSGATRFRAELGGVGACPYPADVLVPACTSASEEQNFANWYSYYRTRIFSAKAGIGRAFQAQGSGMRVGYGRINDGGSTTIDGKSVKTMQRGVRVFKDDSTSGTFYKKDFYDWLYARGASGSTPLRRALDSVGQYYENNNSRSAWSSTPGQSGGEDYTCRQSYTVLMTDGYWNSDDADTANARDNNDGGTVHNTTNSNPSGTPYTYAAADPFQDSFSDTLADVAMYYWKRDLRTDILNEVPPNSVDEAYWQHMSTFSVSFGLTGSVNPNTAFAAINSPAPIAWPDPSTGGSTRIDDLLHAAVNGRGGFFSAANPQTFATALSDTLSAIASRSATASAITGNSARVDTNSAIYQAGFDSGDWSGSLVAYALNNDGSVGGALWDAAAVLPTPATRDIYTYVPGTGGRAFTWANLSTAQQTDLNTLNTTVDTRGADRVDYLRGDQSKEISNGGTFRTRSKVMGDIINSDPYYVGTPDFTFRLLPGAEGTSYISFRASTAYKTRTPMLYAGANDGMLHAFDANTGIEKFAYIPNNVMENLSNLTDPNYTHQYFVDAPPRVVDAYIGSTWKSMLVGATGGGGRAVFALDVTTPDSFTASDVKWEFTHSELGYTIGQPTIARVKAGDEWVAIFGNGYNSQSERAQLFVVRLSDGALLKVIDTKVGSASEPNGLATPIPVDVDNDRITDYVYAGDLRGNMWKFDFTGNNTSTWKSDFGSVASPQPLFTACGGVTCLATNRQPITVRPTIGQHPNGGRMVYFGTGKYLETTDDQVGPTPPIQSFYGIRDNDVVVAGRSSLQEQTIDSEQTAVVAGTTFDVRGVSSNNIDYTTQEGWYMDLAPPPGTVGEGERVVSKALLRFGRIIFVSIIPSQDPCQLGGRNWLMELDAVTGKQLGYAVYDTNGDGVINGLDALYSGKGGDGFVRDPYVSRAKAGDGNIEYKYQGVAGGAIDVTTEVSGGSLTGRQSWRQIK